VRGWDIFWNNTLVDAQKCAGVWVGYGRRKRGELERIGW